MPSVHDTVVGIGFLLGESKGKEDAIQKHHWHKVFFENCAVITSIIAKIHLETII